MVRSSLDCRDDRGRCPLRPDQAPLTLRGAVLCVQGISPHAAEGTKRHGLCSLLLPALGPDRRPPALAPVAAPSQHHAPLPPNGIRARIWLADVLAAGTPISPLSVSLPLVAGRSRDDLQRRQHTDRGLRTADQRLLRGKSPDTTAESASLKGQSLFCSSFWRRRPAAGAVYGAGSGDDRRSTVMQMAACASGAGHVNSTGLMFPRTSGVCPLLSCGPCHATAASTPSPFPHTRCWGRRTTTRPRQTFFELGSQP